MHDTRRHQPIHDQSGRAGNETVAAIGGFIAILFVISAAFAWVTNDGVNLYPSVYVPIAGAVLLGFFGAYWLAFGESMRLLSVCTLAASVACLGIALVELMSSRATLDAGPGGAELGAGAILGLLAAVTATALSAFLVAQAAGATRGMTESTRTVPESSRTTFEPSADVRPPR